MKTLMATSARFLSLSMPTLAAAYAPTVEPEVIVGDTVASGQVILVPLMAIVMMAIAASG